jgi:hypothetical protein
MEEMRPADLTSWRHPGRARSRWPYPFRGARRGGGTGVGDTVLWNDTGLPAQHPHSAGDGRTVQVGRTALGPDSQAVSENRCGGDSPLTQAPRDMSEHSMPQSGEQVWCRWTRAASSEAEPHARGWVPRMRRELARGGAKPSSEAGVS